MGLFVNTSEHPEVFKNKKPINEPNQGYFKYDFFSELVKEQKEVNDSLLEAFREIKIQHKQNQNNQASKWKDIGKQLNDLKERNVKHENFERQAMEWLTMLDKNNTKLKGILENESVLKKEIMEEITVLSQSNQQIVNQLENYGSSHKQISVQMHELFNLHKDMSNQLTKQDENQDQVISQLENQEALLEKTFRQINNIRSILFERANFLAEKIENSYSLTSSFVYKLVNGSDQPLTFFYEDAKKVENKKEYE
ncbi:hypothetical protein ACFQ3N_12995 [Virgibacillus byunsanensis]|uniref:t-SNARE coiled-coil homology domain-containing protein n=1 Tax=Virgibacillus byunsanensis TaxID=570945 RepID=A0ABW3LLT2_9BACI